MKHPVEQILKTVRVAEALAAFEAAAYQVNEFGPSGWMKGQRGGGANVNIGEEYERTIRALIRAICEEEAK